MTKEKSGQKIVSGCVWRNGSTYSGTGFTSKQLETGIYEIIFDVPFNSPPSVVATQQYAIRNSNWDDFNNRGGSVLDNVVLVALDENRVKLKTGNRDGIETSRNFTFIAIGD